MSDKGDITEFYKSGVLTLQNEFGDSGADIVSPIKWDKQVQIGNTNQDDDNYSRPTQLLSFPLSFHHCKTCRVQLHRK